MKLETLINQQRRLSTLLAFIETYALQKNCFKHEKEKKPRAVH